MKTFPMFLRMDGRRVVICGGGEEAARKARLVLKTSAEIVVLADRLDPELAALVASGRARRTSSQLAQLPPAQADVARAEDVIFVAMEAAVTGLYDVVRASGGGPMARARKSAVQCCYVGEEVVIELVLRNPLRKSRDCC